MPTITLNASVVASAVWLVADPPGEVFLRTLSGDNVLLETAPGAPPLQMRGLQLRGSVRVNGSSASFERCAFVGSQSIEGGALAVVGGGRVEAKTCNFTDNEAARGAAVFIGAGEALFDDSRFEDNRATDAGSAIYVRSAGPSGVVLRNHTLFQRNTAPSVKLEEGQLRYQLPAPRGRWIYAPGNDTQDLSISGVEDDFPFACAPGVSGRLDSDEGGVTTQNGPQCTGLCPAGSMCPGATGEPARCSAGGYCAGSNPSATPCPGGTWGNGTGLEAQSQCIKVKKGEWAPIGSSAAKRCPASGFYCPGYDADTVNTPPGSEPILIEAGAARETRDATVVTFGLTLEADVANYDEDATRKSLAALYNVSEASISLAVQPGSLRLIVTIRPADGSDAGVASLTRTVNSASSASQLTASLQVNATMDAAARTETVEEEYEASCPPGFWCSVGNTIACPRSTYNGETDRIDQSACRPCPAHALTTEEGSTSVAACICEEGYFANRTAAPDDEGNGNRSATLRCESCPVSANCTVPGVTFEHLPLQEGHWRAHANTTDVRRCPGNLGGSACVGCGGEACAAADFTGCKELTGGPYCALCEAAEGGGRVYFDRGRAECLPCGAAGGMLRFLVLGVVMVLACCVCLLAACVRWCRTQRATVEQAEAAGRQPTRAGKFVTTKERWWRRHAKSIKRRLKIKVKVLFTFYQIATKVGETCTPRPHWARTISWQLPISLRAAKALLPARPPHHLISRPADDTDMVTFPRSVESTLELFAWTNLELDGLGLPLACVSLASFQVLLLLPDPNARPMHTSNAMHAQCQMH